MQYVDSTNTTINQEGWITLNVSEALQHWINNPDGNRGLYLSVHPADRSGNIIFYYLIFFNMLRLLLEKKNKANTKNYLCLLLDIYKSIYFTIFCLIMFFYLITATFIFSYYFNTQLMHITFVNRFTFDHSIQQDINLYLYVDIFNAYINAVQ